MKKLLVIAAASSFIFISCSANLFTQPTTQHALKSTPVKSACLNPGPPAPGSARQYVITNVDTYWGFAPCLIRFKNANTGQFQTVTLNMGQSITVCLHDISNFSTTFAYTIWAIGNC
jgi:hypothetical protein